jgi:signal transduction histidine kinase
VTVGTGLAGRYREALLDYLLREGGEAALLRAMDCGRDALAAGLNMLDLTALHHGALMAAALGPDRKEEAKRLAERGEEFLIQSLVPYEVVSRGFADSNARLRELNEVLERRVAERTTDLLAKAEALQALSGQLHALNSELEQRVAQRTAELQAANRDLEAFSYSVSHDLRAPLRAVDGFSRIVLEDYAPLLDDEGQEYLQLVRDNAQQMGRLIDDLLSFSRLGRQPLTRHRVRPAEVARRAFAELAPECEGRDVRFTVHDLPACEADAALLKQVFGNLLANALKFTRRREVAVIEVGCEWDGDRPIYLVRDNGAGFDMRYAHKLFGVFQRLHRAEEYEGTGVGLALVQRIVYRHGGRIWAEAALEQGATFRFTLSGGDDGGTAHE